MQSKTRAKISTERQLTIAYAIGHSPCMHPDGSQSCRGRQRARCYIGLWRKEGWGKEVGGFGQWPERQVKLAAVHAQPIKPGLRSTL